MSLSAIADIRAGYPFRGKLEPISGGSLAVVQMKNVAMGRGVSWGGLIRTEPTGIKKPDWLRKDDVLFLAKGRRNFAVHVDREINDMVCSPHFFHVRIKEGAAVLPEFLVWQINQGPAQRYFEKSAEGTAMPSIRRSILAELSIALPSIEMQQLIVDMASAALKEKEILNGLIEAREKQLSAIAQKLLG